MKLAIKRVYVGQSPRDGRRILVDRLWPRGLSKEKAGIALWCREAAPSDALRKCYKREECTWSEFRRRYFDELRKNPSALEPIRSALRAGAVTLVYASRDEKRNNAVALREFLESR